MSVPRSKQATIIMTIHVEDVDLMTKLIQDSKISGEYKIHTKPVNVQVKELGGK